MSFLFEELSREECEAIREEDGAKRGEQRFANLVQELLKSKELNSLARAAADAEYREKLYQKYGL